MQCELLATTVILCTLVIQELLSSLLGLCLILLDSYNTIAIT